jgi:hypothetical protein
MCGHLDVPTDHQGNCSEYPLAWGLDESQCQTVQYVGGTRKRLHPDGNRITTPRLASHSLGVFENYIVKTSTREPHSRVKDSKLWFSLRPRIITSQRRHLELKTQEDRLKSVSIKKLSGYESRGWNYEVFQFNRFVRPGTHYPHVTWARVMLLVHLGYFNIEFWRRLTLMSLCLRHVIWRGTLVGSRASTPLKFLLSPHTFRETCRVLFRHCYQLFPENEEMLIEKVRQRTFLYDTKSSDYRDQHKRANAREEIGKELKIKC